MNLLESHYGMSLLRTSLWYEFTVTYSPLLELYHDDHAHKPFAVNRQIR
jgi:hypothetical protein